MKCVVLAAGYATRLYPLTENMPKPLLPVCKKPILNWLLEDIDTLPEITEHIIISNHKFIYQFEAWKKEQSFQKPLVLLDDGSMDNEHRLGAVTDIGFAVNQLGLADELLVIAGDNMVEFSFAGFLTFFKEKNASCIMCYEEPDLAKQRRTGIITTDNMRCVTSMEEKPQAPKSNLAVPPFYAYKQKDIACIGEAISDGCGSDAPGNFAAWLCRHSKVYAWEMPGHRYDIGDMDTYTSVQNTYKGVQRA